MNGNKINCVSEFKLLGIILDSKLNFVNHANELKENKEQVKTPRFLIKDSKTFFKTFILPYFDFGLSLMIYFSKAAIDKLSKKYYFCLYHLFKYSPQDKEVKYINKYLRLFNILSFQHHLSAKLSFFAFKIKYANNLLDDLRLKLSTNNDQNSYAFRTSALHLIIKSSKAAVKYGERELTFQNFYAKMINNSVELKLLFANSNFQLFK